jgi:hypothetical protein
MRTLGFHTHVTLAVAAAVGVLLSLSRSWYGATGPAQSAEDDTIGQVHGPLENMLPTVQRWVGDDGQTGFAALSHWGTVIMALAAMAALGGLLCFVAPLQAAGRELLRYGTLGTVAMVIWKLVDTPGANSSMEPRLGALLAAGCSAILLATGLSAAGAPLRRKAPVSDFVSPAPGAPVYDTSGSAAPPGP